MSFTLFGLEYWQATLRRMVEHILRDDKVDWSRVIRCRFEVLMDDGEKGKVVYLDTLGRGFTDWCRRQDEKKSAQT